MVRPLKKNNFILCVSSLNDIVHISTEWKTVFDGKVCQKSKSKKKNANFPRFHSLLLKLSAKIKEILRRQVEKKINNFWLFRIKHFFYAIFMVCSKHLCNPLFLPGGLLKEEGEEIICTIILRLCRLQARFGSRINKQFL